MNYPVINKETGDKMIIERSCNDIMDWYKENPEWERDWSKGAASIGEVGDWKIKNVNKNPGWKDVLDGVKKAPGNNVSNSLY